MKALFHSQVLIVYSLHLYCVLANEKIILNDDLIEEPIDESLKWRRVADSIKFANTAGPGRGTNSPESFYDFDVLDLDGKQVSLDSYRGMVTLVVNVASECGYTDNHYRGLIRLQNILGQHNKFTVLAFPCNQFGAQEPGSRDEIKQFTKEHYQVNFPVFDKVNVIPPDVSEPWDYLISFAGVEPTWNFWKYLIDENGHVVKAWGPWITVEDIFMDVRNVVNEISTHAYDEL